MSFGNAVRSAMENEQIEPSRGAYKTRLVEGDAFEYSDKKTGADRQAAKVIHEITEFPAGATYTTHDGDTVKIAGGERFLHFMGFYPEGIAQMNGNACAIYGVNWGEVHDVGDLRDQLQAVVAQGTTAEVTVAYKDGYMNVNVHRTQTVGQSDIPTNGSSGPSSFAAAAGTQSDDTPPF